MEKYTRLWGTKPTDERAESGDIVFLPDKKRPGNYPVLGKVLSNAGCTATIEYSPTGNAKQKRILQQAWNNIAVVVRLSAQRTIDLDIYYIMGQDGMTELSTQGPPDMNTGNSVSKDPNID